MKTKTKKSISKTIDNKKNLTDLRFILKVDQGRTLTLCPIILILWSVG